ncbi:MAG: OST-HTH/LOTUS domain-containing protein [Rubrivivax sp.]|nr:OST-HTH/LOTUS domain-containing protein [Rubrivivax sp.]
MGRCLLRLQQYERLLKALLAGVELCGPADELEARQASRIDKFAKKTLGQLVENLFEDYVVAEGAPSEPLDDTQAPTDRVSMAFRFRLEMTDERRAEVKAAIEELVRLRNGLVHHLIEQFDCWTDEGCEAAIEHLTHSYDRIDLHFHELRQWAEHMEEARVATADFMRSSAFQDMVVNGIAPDGTVDWPHAGIVRALVEAVKADSVDGWVRLDAARAWMGLHHPDQVPERYGCRTWPQVLSESRLFRLEYRVQGDRRVPWFRSLA